MAAKWRPFLFFCVSTNRLICQNVLVMTASDVHRKIQEISQKYISGAPPITVENLSSELGITIMDLTSHLKSLTSLGLVVQDGDAVVLTESGKKASLP